MLNQVRATISKYNLFRAGDRILVGVSGGPDSAALLHALWRLQHELQVRIVVAHLDHMFRGGESVADARYVESLAQTLKLEAVIGQCDVPAIWQEQGGSKQALAREARFAFLGQAAREKVCNKLALGHTKDDQVETVIMRFLRGAGLGGLAGIPPVRCHGDVSVVRPLLEVGKEEVLAYCRQEQLAFRQDASNLSPVYQRNKIRLELLPLLETDYNPNLRGVLAANSQLWREEEQFLQEQARTLWREALCQEKAGWFSLSREKLADSHPVLVRRVIRLAVEGLVGETVDIAQVHLDGAQEFIAGGRVGAVLTLPRRIRLECTYKELLMYIDPGPKTPIADYSFILPVPGQLDIARAGMQIQAAVHTGNQVEVDNGSWRAAFDWDSITPPLWVRNRRPGDRFYPLGLGGSKKLQDFFVDEKIPRQRRDLIPVVTTDKGEIVWVVGYRPDARFISTPATKQVLSLTALPLRKE